MPKVSVYRCPFTKKVFERYEEYRTHLLRLRKHRSETRRLEKKKRDALAELLAETATFQSVDDIAWFVRRNYKKIMLVNIPIVARRHIRAINDLYLDGFDLSVHYRDHCSNYHHCPRNGVVNWGADPGKPVGYPGLQGHVMWTMKEPTPREDDDAFTYSFRDALGLVGIHIGNSTVGRYGEQAHEVTIFTDDFEALKKKIFFDKLAGNPLP